MHPPRVITWSPSLTIPLTHDCPWNCAYCGYRSDREGLISEAEFERLLAQAERQGATEILFLSGEIPDALPHVREELRRRGFRDFTEFARQAALRALDRGFLPHSNFGALSPAQLERLADVNASMGVMLENIDDAFNRTVAPQKSAASRLRTLDAAGRARIPWTSGLLLGLGESRESRLRSLDALAESHARHGHLQEIILQNFVPNHGSRLRQAATDLALEEYLELIEHWNRVAPGVAIQIPPNLNPHWEELLPHVDDLGGISAEGDLVNPDNPWEPPAHYAERCRARGATLRHRWPVYDRFIERGWVSPRILDVIRRRKPHQDAVAGNSTPPSEPPTTPIRSRRPEPLSLPFLGRSLEPADCEALVNAGGAAPQELAAAARELNHRLHGDVVTYVVNRNANFTNVCTTNCTFCGFYRPPGHPEAYTRSADTVVQRILQTPWVTEVCLQGGIHPDLKLTDYCDLLRAIRAALPRVHLHAFSPMEIHSLQLKTGLSYERILGDLIEAGLGSTPGTAAEILDDHVRDRLSPHKLKASEWVEIITTAHRLGLRSTATVMFGHRETWADLFRHFDLLRRLQRQTGGFTEFIPLAFVPFQNRLGSQLAAETGRTKDQIAREGQDKIQALYPLARLFFGAEIPNLQTSWVKLGPVAAAQMLNCGCNDFGGTLYEESITRESGGPYGECMTPAEIQSAIQSVGKIPRQRTTLYGPVDR